jgi:hypothetical protein
MRLRRPGRRNAGGDGATGSIPTCGGREEADLRTQMFGIGGDGAQGFSGGSEENAVDHLLVLPGNRGNLLGNGEHHVEVLAVEQFGLPTLDPLGARQ